MPEPGSVREEAERLVVAALASVSVAANRIGYHVEAGCGCPLCRAVMALRDPDPVMAERLASRAGDLAEGVAGLLRSLGPAGEAQAEPGPGGAEHPQRSRERDA